MRSWIKKLFLVAAIVPMGVSSMAYACCGGTTHNNFDGTAQNSVTTTSMMGDVTDVGSSLEYPALAIPEASGQSALDGDEVF